MLVTKISNNSKAHRLESGSSSAYNLCPPSSSSASLFCALPPWPLVRSSQSLPCLTDFASPLHLLPPPSSFPYPLVETFSSVPRAWAGTQAHGQI